MPTTHRPRRAGWFVLGVAGVLVALVVGVAVYLWLVSDDDGVEPGPVDAALVAQIRELGVTPYLVSLDDAAITDVKVEDDAVLISYERDRAPAYTLVIDRATQGDMCGPEGSGEYEDGGSCTSDGDRSSTEFEEFGSFSLRKGDTEVTIGSIVIESDPDLPDRAYEALEDAEQVSAEELSRY